ncbi:hypothetical protein H4R33_006563 [Dimargaris cristalligena]|nr:hypothetical protein H4R33_006563 [Dimargaris cristalligena]
MKLSLLFVLTQTWLLSEAIHRSPALDSRPAKRVRLMSAKTASRNVDIPFDTYLQLQYDFSLDAIQRAVSPAGAAKGAMQASPSRVHPDYFYHWVRDAGLTMSLVNQLYADATDQTQRDSWGTILADHADFSRRLQETDNPSHGLGEPKFNMNGSAFWENWGRPQNDGPAIRAYAIIEYGHLWAKQGGDWSRLYTSEWPATSVIKRDLEYTAHHWEEPSFDVWEEVSGQHFFNFMVSRRAMREGASLARQFDDTGASDYYAQQEDRIASRLDEFWDATKGYVTTTRNYHRGLGDKETGDTYMRRIHKMGRMDLNLYEQWGRESGQSRGAPHLTWSYAAFITAIRAREQLNL